MKTELILKPGIICLKDYATCFLTIDDIDLIKSGAPMDKYLPIPLKEKHFGILGFSPCQDRFGKGTYYKAYSLNLWKNKHSNCYYACYNKSQYYFQYLHFLQYFMTKTVHNGLLNGIVDFSLLIDTINRDYDELRQLFRRKWTVPIIPIDLGKKTV